MPSAQPSISPRGIPPIRPDWLIDVTWRLAELGLDPLRSLPEAGRYTLEDVVDGERWRFVSTRLSPDWSSAVEHDADLYLPTDDGRPTLRAGFAFTPWFEAGTGRGIQARVEIGPRGPVTFDPENWIVVLPLPEAGAPRPALSGIEAGAWQFDGAAAAPLAPAVPADVIGSGLGFRDLSLIGAGHPVPELLLAATPLVAKRKLLGGERLVPAASPDVILRLSADGPLEANWTGDVPLASLVPRGLARVDAIDVVMGRCTIRSAQGALSITGLGLEARAGRLA